MDSRIDSPRPAVRILVVANEAAAGDALHEEIERRAGSPDAEVFVLCPALDTRRQRWLSGGDDEVAKASERLLSALAALEKSGLRVRGQVGDADLGRALNDVVKSFEPSEIVISTHSDADAGWLDQRLIRRAEKRFGVPITQVVLDPETEGPSADDATVA